MTAPALTYLKRANGGHLFVKPQNVNAVLTDADGNTVVRVGSRGYTVEGSIADAYIRLFPDSDMPVGFAAAQAEHPDDISDEMNGEDDDAEDDEEEDEEEEVD